MNREIKNALVQLMADSGKSQKQVAGEIGISVTTLNQYLQDKYPGDVENVEKQVKKYFDLMEKANAVEKMPDYVDTSISEMVYQSITLCHINKSIGVFVGDAGIGKTKGAEKYQEDHGQAIMITATRACKNLKDIYSLIAEELRIDTYMRLPVMEKAIKEKLFGSNKIIIIDEAQHLPITALDGIRTLNDRIRKNEREPIALFFIGNKELWSKICGTQALDQVRNRIRLPRIVQASEIMEEDIKKLFPIYREKSYEKEIKFLYSIAQSRWAVRGASYLFQNAHLNGDISIKGLKSIAATMGIYVKD